MFLPRKHLKQQFIDFPIKQSQEANPLSFRVSFSLFSIKYSMVQNSTTYPLCYCAHMLQGVCTCMDFIGLCNLSVVGVAWHHRIVEPFAAPVPELKSRQLANLLISHIKYNVQNMKITVVLLPTASSVQSASKSVFCWSHLARPASSRPLRPVTMQPRQRAWHRRANRRAPGMPADGRAVRTGCENGTPRCSHTFTHAQSCRLLLCVLTARQAQLPLPSSTG